jgi:hypothetical protein
MQRSRGSAIRGSLAALAALLLLGISAEDTPRGGESHTDAVPSARKPGFEPVDVSAEMEEIRSRDLRRMQEQVDAEAYYRHTTPERRLRARYGSATWNLYEPYE